MPVICNNTILDKTRLDLLQQSNDKKISLKILVIPYQIHEHPGDVQAQFKHTGLIQQKYGCYQYVKV
jgi:hypothetical protein